MGTNKLIIILFLFFLLAFTVTDSNIGTRELSVTAYGFSKNNTPAENSQAIHDAIMDANGVFKRIVSIPKGTFAINNISIDYDGISIVGSGQPSVNEDKTALVGGSSLVGGRISLNNKRYITISDLGVDVSDVSSRDAITGGTAYVENQYCTIRNVTTLGSGGRHGVVFPFGDRNTLENIKSYEFFHAWACRGSYNQVNTWYSYNCSVTGGIFKSVGSVDAVYNQASNGIIEGDSLGSTGGIFVSAFTTGTRAEFNQFNNVIMKFPNYGIRCSGDGDANYNSFSNIIIEESNFRGVLVQNTANENSFMNVSVINPNGVSFEIDGTGAENDLFNCRSVSAATDILNGSTPFRTQQVL